jgi:hypothetical protein
MTVPEASMYKDCFASADESNIWLAWQIPTM